jgi:endonuclease/exonuclease/phosphatase family metal-dependent hydrolase
VTSARPGLRVVSYNLHSLRDDRRALVATVRELAPDVILLQEAPRRFRWRARCAALAHDLGLVVAAGGSPAVGNLILTDLRVAVRHTRTVRFRLTPGRHLRGAALAWCEVGRSRFVAVGSHLSTDSAERPHQARQLADEVTGLDAPVVLGADVNDVPGSAAWQALTRVLADAGAGPSARPATFPSRAPARRIDAIFVDAGVIVDTCRVVDTPEARRASDHLPVLAELRLPAPRGAAPGGQDRAGRE